MDKKEAREIFESEFGRRISDATWYRLQTIFCSEFPKTKQNIIWLARIKRQLPKCDLTLLPVVNCVKQVNQLINSQNSQITGKQLLELFEQYDISVHRNTLTKWFKPIHGFRQNRTYSIKEITPIVLAAYAYKLRQTITSATNSLNIKAS